MKIKILSAGSPQGQFSSATIATEQLNTKTTSVSLINYEHVYEST